MTKRFLVMCLAASICGLTAFATGCGKKKGGSTSSDSTTPITLPPAPVVSQLQPMAVSVFTVFEGGDGAVTTWNYNTINGAAPATPTGTCSVTPSNPTAVCEITFPEGLLYFSNVGIRFSFYQVNDSSNASCRLTYFEPYYYMANNQSPNVTSTTTANFFPLWAGGLNSTAVSCVGPISSNCFFGAAPRIIPGFPINTRLYYPPNLNGPGMRIADPILLPSPWKTGDPLSTRLVVNDMPGSAAAVNQQLNTFYMSPTLAWTKTYNAANNYVDGYVAGTWHDYRFYCADDWADPRPYLITLKFHKENSKGLGAALNDPNNGNPNCGSPSDSKGGLDVFKAWECLP